MRVLAIVHEADAGPGVFLEPIAAAGLELDTWNPAQELQPLTAPDSYGAILTFGGSVHPVQDQQHPWLTVEKRFLARALGARVPLLGVCLGAQLLAVASGADVRRASAPEIGWYDVRVTAEGAADPLFGPLADGFEALEWHSYEFSLPAGAIALAYSDVCLQGYRIGDRAWGTQFHAEVTAADFRRWLQGFGADADAVAMGLDVTRLANQTDARIGVWHELGRGLCERFLKVAAEFSRDAAIAAR